MGIANVINLNSSFVTKGEDMYSSEHANLSLTTLLSELEDANDNNELLRVIAKELGFDDLEEKIAHMKAVHRSIGNMPHHLYMEREKYRKEIKERGVNHPNWDAVKDFV